MKKVQSIMGTVAAAVGDLLYGDRQYGRVSPGDPFRAGSAAGGSAGAPGCKRLKAELTLSAYGEKGTALAGKILLANKSMFSADRILCRVSCENLLTGEKEVVSVHMAAPSKSNTDTEFQLKSRHAGKVRLSLQKMICYDPFGLFPVKTAPSGEVLAFTLVAPESFSLETQIAYGESTNMDSDEYSMKKRVTIRLRPLQSVNISRRPDPPDPLETDGEV